MRTLLSSLLKGLTIAAGSATKALRSSSPPGRARENPLLAALMEPSAEFPYTGPHPGQALRPISAELQLHVLEKPEKVIERPTAGTGPLEKALHERGESVLAKYRENLEGQKTPCPATTI